MADSLPAGLNLQVGFDNDGSSMRPENCNSASNNGIYDVTQFLTEQILVHKLVPSRWSTLMHGCQTDQLVFSNNWLWRRWCELGNFYLVYICEMIRAHQASPFFATTSVTLDASNSEPYEDNNKDVMIASQNTTGIWILRGWRWWRQSWEWCWSNRWNRWMEGTAWENTKSHWQWLMVELSVLMTP